MSAFLKFTNAVQKCISGPLQPAMPATDAHQCQRSVQCCLQLMGCRYILPSQHLVVRQAAAKTLRSVLSRACNPEAQSGTDGMRRSV